MSRIPSTEPPVDNADTADIVAQDLFAGPLLRHNRNQLKRRRTGHDGAGGRGKPEARAGIDRPDGSNHRGSESTGVGRALLEAVANADGRPMLP